MPGAFSYTLVLLFVNLLLLGLLLYPFFRVIRILHDRHPDIWKEFGPFTVRGLLSSDQVMANFLTVINLSDRDADIRTRDRDLVRWSRLCREMTVLTPSQFRYQVLLFVLVLFFTGKIAAVLVEAA